MARCRWRSGSRGAWPPSRYWCCWAWRRWVHGGRPAAPGIIRLHLLRRLTNCRNICNIKMSHLSCQRYIYIGLIPRLEKLKKCHKVNVCSLVFLLMGNVNISFDIRQKDQHIWTRNRFTHIHHFIILPLEGTIRQATAEIPSCFIFYEWKLLPRQGSKTCPTSQKNWKNTTRVQWYTHEPRILPSEYKNM